LAIHKSPLQESDKNLLHELLTKPVGSATHLWATAFQSATPEKALVTLNQKPASYFRDVQMSQVLTRAIASSPASAEKLMAENVSMIQPASMAAVELGNTNSGMSAQIVNAIPGERQRRIAAGATAWRISEKTAKNFLENLTDPLTRQFVETVYRKRGLKVFQTPPK
jgi:hypothetical protein